MTGENLDRTLTVQHRDAADALLKSEIQRTLAVFLPQALTAHEAAQQLGVETNSLLYSLKKLTALGLLEQVGEKTRTGRPMKLYRAAASVYFVPFSVTRALNLQSYLEQVEMQVGAFLRDQLVHLLEEQHQDWGLRFSARLALSAQQDLEVQPEQAIMLNFMYPYLQLDFEEAQAFQKDLLELFQRYAQMRGAQRYAFRLTLLPVVTPQSSRGF
jgi:predicted ArsR family transcriptional regulator